MSESVIVAAYPKSGSTYLSRLLGDALNSPVDGVADAVPLAREGQDRKGDYTVYQTHLAPHHAGIDQPLIPDRYQFNLDKYDPSRHIVIHLVRDPRAIAVSAKYYWETKTVEDALDAMYHGGEPMGYHYSSLVRGWLRTEAYQIRYEDLLDSPESILIAFFQHFNIPYSIRRVRRAIERQEFATRKKELEGSGDRYPYSCGIQSHNLRSGRKGEWRQHWNSNLNAKAVKYFGEIMKQLDYPLEDVGWENALVKMREVFDILPDAGLRKAQVLYELARQATSGDLVELGVAQGKGVVAMALGAKDGKHNLIVYGVDDYIDHSDWANLHYDESNLSILTEHLKTLCLDNVGILREDAVRMGELWKNEHSMCALWCWDVSTNADDLWNAWLAWYLHIQVGGIAFVRDLYDKRFDSDRVREHALANGFVVENEEPGILLLRKI